MKNDPNRKEDIPIAFNVLTKSHDPNYCKVKENFMTLFNAHKDDNINNLIFWKAR